jgi:thiol-disulfide isomerase/thioredoxin
MFALAVGAKAQGIQVGAAVEDFSLSDTTGKVQSFNSLKGKNGTVLIWLSAQCPVVKGYHERINSISADYAAKGINFVGINSNATEDLNWVKSDADTVGYKFPILIDKGNVLADKLGATVTPEIFFVDAKGKLLYHGALDNDRSGRNVQERYAQAAFDAALTGQKIAQSSTKAFGCEIKRAAKTQ